MKAGKIYFLCYALENDENEYRVLSSETNIITTMKYAEWFKLQRKFFLMDGYDATDESLFKFAEDFKQYVAELKTNKIYKLDILFYYGGLNTIVKQVFKRFAKGRYEDHEPISKVEKQWSNACYNSGLMYCDDDIGDEYIESHTYDYNSMYPRVMASDKFYIPKKQGKEHYLKSLPKITDIQVGYYHVKITCEDNNFKKLFAFSKKNVYADRSLYQAMKYQDEFNVKIKLVDNVKYNAYLYDEECLTNAKRIFGKWFKIMSALKKEFPKNKIIKFLGSSLHGQLQAKHLIFKTPKQITDEKLDVGINDSHRYVIVNHKIYGTYGKPDYKEYYELHDTETPTEFNIRLGAFLTAYVRNKTSRLVTGHVFFGKDIIRNKLHDLDTVIRIHTDAVTFTEPMDHLDDVDDLKKESKSSGKIKWKNVNTYFKKCVKCKIGVKNSEISSHKCSTS